MTEEEFRMGVVRPHKFPGMKLSEEKSRPGAVMLRKAAEVIDQRGQSYGDPRADFERADRLMTVIQDCKDPAAREALRMICVKMARLCESPNHEDSWLDIAGYAACGLEVTRE